jgi:glycosyltransferase involved in cell wall biosynthesis
VKPLRVCVDARLGDGRFGGVEQFVIGLAAGLSRLEDGDEEYLFLTYRGQDEWLRPYLEGPSRILSCPRRYPRRLARAALERLPKVGLGHAVRHGDGTAERAGAEVIHFPFQDAFLTELPSIYQPHDLQHLHLPDLFSDWQRERREVVYRTHCERAETVVSMTSWGKQDLIEHYALSAEKVRVVPGGSVLADYPAPAQADLEALRSRLSVPEGFLLYPAQTWPHKNHRRLLDALARIRDEHGTAIPLVCPGRHTEDFQDIEQRVQRLGLAETTRFPGFVSGLELRGLYEMATALVFPSRFEGWGLPICEAFSAGLPVACSSATGLPDVVGEAGLIFDPDDTEQMAEVVWRLWSEPDLRATLAESGRERGSQFSFDHAARLFRAHYRRIAHHPLSEEDRILLAAPPPA